MSVHVYLPEGVSLVRDTHPAVRRALGLLECVVRSTPEPKKRVHVHLGVAQTDRVVAQVQANLSRPGVVFLLLSTGLLDQLSDEEACSVIAHELGHIHLGHLRANRGFFLSWGLGALAGGIAMSLTRLAGVPDETMSWAGLGVGLFVFLASGPWAKQVVTGWDELLADRFSARLVGVRTAVRTLRKVQPLFDPKAATERGWKVGRRPPSSHFRIRSLFRSRRELKTGFH